MAGKSTTVCNFHCSPATEEISGKEQRTLDGTLVDLEKAFERVPREVV